jgi:hypothetical protein
MPTANKALRDLLLPAYGPCDGFAGPCQTMRWEPGRGHVPRGFCGATGKLEAVRLVLVTAEPGNPHPAERHSHRSPQETFDSAYSYAYSCFKTGTDLFHRNVRRVLDLCFPGRDFDEQLRMTWITDSVLCSAVVEGGSVRAAVTRACRDRYLGAQLNLFPDAVVAALGSKARDRMRGLPREFVEASAVAPPGCNHKGASESWQAIADCLRSKGL